MRLHTGSLPPPQIFVLYKSGCEGFCYLKGIADRKATPSRIAWVISSCGVHGQVDEGSSCIRVVVRGTLAHQIRQEETLFSPSFVMFSCSLYVFCADDFIHPPFVAGSCTQHASHQVIVAVCVCECVQGIVAVYAEFVAGMNTVRLYQGNVAHAVAYGSGSTAAAALSPAPLQLYRSPAVQVLLLLPVLRFRQRQSKLSWSSGSISRKYRRFLPSLDQHLFLTSIRSMPDASE